MPKAAMEQKTFYGPIRPDDFAQALIAEFHQGNLNARAIGRGDQRIVQIATPPMPRSGGRTAITVHLTAVEDGVHVRLGQQDWLGVAASLGVSALATLRRPINLLHRLDDIAQDISSMQLAMRIWQAISDAAESLGVSHELSDRLRRLSCEYCRTANPVGIPHCIACGAPLGPNQPVACIECGFLLEMEDPTCPQCGSTQHS
jgi:hypothetical protein